jgi:antitoxin (DNA-binding transcriptional repressor) of toxin-antitoxin stability system
MTTTFEIEDAEALFDVLIGRAERGEEIIFVRSGKPVAKLTPLPGDELSPPRRADDK